jgi:hypothetical protein
MDAARENFARVLKRKILVNRIYAEEKRRRNVPALTYSSAIMREGVAVGAWGVVVDISN